MSADLKYLFENSSANISEYFQVLNNSPFAVVISDNDDNILFANDEAKRWFSINYENNSNCSLNAIFGKNIKQWNKIRSNLHTGDSGSFEGKARHHEISDIDVFCRKIVLSGQQVFVSFIRDVSTQKALEKELLNEKTTRELILNSIPAMVFVKDTENRIISMNTACREITGLSEKDVAGKNLIDLINDKQLAAENWKDDLEVIETGLPKRNIIEPLITDHRKWFITDKVPYRNNHDEIVGIIGFSIDITERKNAEDALMRSEKKFRLLFDTSPDGIVISDLSGKFLSANKAFHNLLGYTDNEIPVLSYKTISPNQYQGEELDFIQSALDSDITYSTFEKEYIARNNLLVPVRVTCWIIYNEIGKPIQLGAGIKDLTFEKKAQQLEQSLLQKEKEQLEKDLKTKTQELNSKITQLVEKNELVSSVVGQLENLIGKHNPLLDSEIKMIIRDLKNNTNENFWIQFETTFGLINQSFYDNINRTFPNLTNNERKISAFLKMNLSTKEIANITHQSIRSIEMARSRLRTKLNLTRSDNLPKFLNQF